MIGWECWGTAFHNSKFLCDSVKYIFKLAYFWYQESCQIASSDCIVTGGTLGYKWQVCDSPDIPALRQVLQKRTWAQEFESDFSCSPMCISALIKWKRQKKFVSVSGQAVMHNTHKKNLELFSSECPIQTHFVVIKKSHERYMCAFAFSY